MNDKEIIRKVELLLNEKLAELEMLRTIMQKFLMRMVTAGGPDGAEERLEALKTDTMATLTARPSGPVDQGDERMRQLIADRGKEFFRELEAYLAEALKIAGGKGMN